MWSTPAPLDILLMLEYSYYSVISPEGCAAILWKNGEMAPQAAEALKLTAKDLYKLKLVDEIVKEPLGGSHRDPSKMAFILRDRILKHLKQFEKLSLDDLLDRRYKKYRQIGNLPSNVKKS